MSARPALLGNSVRVGAPLLRIVRLASTALLRPLIQYGVLRATMGARLTSPTSLAVLSARLIVTAETGLRRSVRRARTSQPRARQSVCPALAAISATTAVAIKCAKCVRKASIQHLATPRDVSTVPKAMLADGAASRWWTCLYSAAKMATIAIQQAPLTQFSSKCMANTAWLAYSTTVLRASTISNMAPLHLLIASASLLASTAPLRISRLPMASCFSVRAVITAPRAPTAQCPVLSGPSTPSRWPRMSLNASSA